MNCVRPLMAACMVLGSERGIMDTTTTRLTASDLTLIGKASASASAWGTPIRVTTEGRYTVLWYGSPAQAYADHIYVADGRIAVISRSDMRSPKSIAPYLTTYGSPTVSYSAPYATQHDSSGMAIFVWPSQGRLVVATSVNPGGIIREEAFVPVADQSVFSATGSAGDRFVGYAPSRVDARVFMSPASAPIIPIIVAIAMVVVAASIVFRKLRNRG